MSPRVLLCASLTSQDDASNPLVGVSGRTQLLQRLGVAIESEPVYFAAAAIDRFSRPGTLDLHVLFLSPCPLPLAPTRSLHPLT
jgi:hypothetical protein